MDKLNLLKRKFYMIGGIMGIVWGILLTPVAWFVNILKDNPDGSIIPVIIVGVFFFLCGFIILLLLYYRKL